MAKIFARSQREQNKSAWIPIDDPTINDDDLLVHFGIEMPPWASHRGYYNLHLFHRRRWTLPDVAVNLWGARSVSNNARRVIEYLEGMAREAKWYDAEKFPNIREHSGRYGGILIGSSALLLKYMQTMPFRADGYYAGDELIMPGDPIDVNNRDAYQPG